MPFTLSYFTSLSLNYVFEIPLQISDTMDSAETFLCDIHDLFFGFWYSRKVDFGENHTCPCVLCSK